MAFENWQLQPGTLFEQGPVVPVIVIKDLADAVPMAQAINIPPACPSTS